MASPAFSATLWLIPGVYFLFVAAEFVVLTHLALMLTAQGASAFAVGALASAFWSGIFVASTAAHALVQRLGHARCFLVAMAASATEGGGLTPRPITLSRSRGTPPMVARSSALRWLGVTVRSQPRAMRPKPAIRSGSDPW